MNVQDFLLSLSLMSLFSGNERYLGIDIANSAIKIVELENNKGRPKLITYGYEEYAKPIFTADNAHTKEAKDAVVEVLKRVQKAARTSTTQVVAALPTYTVFSSIIHLPHMSKKELQAAVQWEAKKFVPMPLPEMIIDWKILKEDEDASEVPQQQLSAMQSGAVAPGLSDAKTAKITSSGKQKYLKILLTAAPKKLVSRYLEIFKEAKLDLVSLETESFALERSLIGNDKSPIMILDMGAGATTISVVLESVPLINRSIDIGGETITQAIGNSLNLERERAEQFKKDFGISADESSAAAAQIPQRIEFMVESIVNEIKYVLNLYQSQGNTAPIEKVILAGGSAWLPNIHQYFAQVLQRKVYLGDPWSRVMYPVDLKPVLQKVGPQMAVAIGLAMREIQ